MTVEVRYLGHLGNNLFQYALGRILAEELGSALKCRALPDTRGWSVVEQMSGIVDHFVTRNFWSADRADIALEVAETRYRYVDDVAITDWRPFEPRAEVEWHLDDSDSPQPRLRGRHGQTTLNMSLTPELAPLATWLMARRSAFGLNDIEACELSPAARQDAPRLLLALARHGLLGVAPNVQDGLAAVYGEVRAAS